MILTCMQCGAFDFKAVTLLCFANWEELGSHIESVHPSSRQVDIRKYDLTLEEYKELVY